MRSHLPWVPDMWEVCGGCISYSHLLRTLVRIMPGSEVEVIFHLLPGRSLWLVSVTTTCSEETDVCARSHSLEEIGPSPWGFPFTSLWLVMVWTCLTLDPRGPVWELLVVCKVFPSLWHCWSYVIFLMGFLASKTNLGTASHSPGMCNNKS